MAIKTTPSKAPNPSSLPSAGITRVRISPNGKLVLGVGTVLSMFRRDDGKSALVNISGSAFSGTQNASARIGNFSPDNKYFCFSSSTAPFISVWKDNGFGTFVKQADSVFESIVALSTPECGFHEIEPYLFCGHSGGTCAIYKYDTVANTFKRVNITFSGTTPTGINYAVKMSPNGQWLAMANDQGITKCLYKITRNSEFAWTLTAVSVSVINGTFSGDKYGVSWSPDSRVFVISGATVAPRAFRINYANGTATEVNLPSGGQVNFTMFSPDGEWLVAGQLTTPFLQMWPYDSVTGTFGARVSQTSWAAPGNTQDVGITPDGLNLIAVHSSNSPYITEWILGDGVINASLGSIQMQAVASAPDSAAIAMSLKSITTTAFGYTGNPGWPDAYPDLRTTKLIQITATPIDPRIKPVRTVTVTMSLGKVTAALTTHFNLEAFVDQQLQPMQMAALGAQPNSGDMVMALGKVDMQAIVGPYRAYGEFELKKVQMQAVVGPYRAYGVFQLRPVEMTAEIAKANLNASIEMALSAVTMDAEMYNPYLGFMTMSLGALTTEIVASAPATATVDMRLGKISSEIIGVIPDVARITMSLGKVSSEIIGVIPDVARITMTLGKISMAAEAKVPIVARAAMSLGRISTDGYVMVPTVARIEASLQPVQMLVQGFSIAYVDVLMRLNKIGATIIVSPPITISADLELPFMEVAGDIMQTLELRDGAGELPFMEAAGILELFLAVNVDAVLPFVEFDGLGHAFNTLGGDLVLPFMETPGEIRQDIFINADAVLPYVVVSGRTHGEAVNSPVGDAPALGGAATPEAGIRAGGGVFMNFDSFTIG